MEDEIILKTFKQETEKMNQGLEKLVIEKMAFALFVAEYYRFIFKEIDDHNLRYTTKKEIIDLWKSVKQNDKEFCFLNRARELLNISEMKDKENGNN